MSNFALSFQDKFLRAHFFSLFKVYINLVNFFNYCHTKNGFYDWLKYKTFFVSKTISEIVASQYNETPFRGIQTVPKINSIPSRFRGLDFVDDFDFFDSRICDREKSFFGSVNFAQIQRRSGSVEDLKIKKRFYFLLIIYFAAFKFWENRMVFIWNVW